METVEYKITNSTQWPGIKKGKHKKGFIIAINRRNLHVGRYMIVPTLTESLEALQQKKYIKVEVIKDRHISINENIMKQEKANEADRQVAAAEAKQAAKDAAAAAKQKKIEELKALDAQTTESSPSSSLDKDAMKQTVKDSNPENTASVSGQGQGSNEDPMDGVESAAYTDGKEPNFVVKAGKNSKGKNRN